MSKMKLPDAVQFNTASLSCIAHEMECLADSFFDVGNKVVSEKLEKWSQSLIEARDRVKEAHSEDLYSQVQQAEESSMNVFRAALAGIEVGSESKGEDR